MSKNYFFLLLFSVFLGSAGQVLLKAGANRLQAYTLSVMALPRQLYRLALSPEIAVGIIFFTLSCLLWIKVLTRADLSRAYPMVSLGYINITICSYFFFHEAFTFTKLLGTVFIIIGVVVINS